MMEKREKFAGKFSFCFFFFWKKLAEAAILFVFSLASLICTVWLYLKLYAISIYSKSATIHTKYVHIFLYSIFIFILDIYQEHFRSRYLMTL